jgi:hypothetical protein
MSRIRLKLLGRGWNKSKIWGQKEDFVNLLYIIQNERENTVYYIFRSDERSEWS